MLMSIKTQENIQKPGVKTSEHGASAKRSQQWDLVEDDSENQSNNNPANQAQWLTTLMSLIQHYRGPRSISLNMALHNPLGKHAIHTQMHATDRQTTVC